MNKGDFKEALEGVINDSLELLEEKQEYLSTRGVLRLRKVINIAQREYKLMTNGRYRFSEVSRAFARNYYL